MFKRLSCLVIVLGLFLGGMALPVIASEATGDNDGTEFVGKGAKAGKGGKKKGGKKKGGKKKGGKKKKATTEA